MVKDIAKSVRAELLNISKQEKQVYQTVITRYIYERLTVDRFNAEHQTCLQFIKDAAAVSQAENIVVLTHHVPSNVLSSSDFESSQINGAFVSEQYDFIESSNIDYWIYGHSHRNIDAVIGKTKCVSNQLGYIFSDEHHSFDGAKYIEI